MARRLPPNIRNNNGTLSFLKRIPKEVLHNSYWAGKTFHTQQLGLPENAFYDDIERARHEALNRFNEICEALKASSAPEMSETELLRHGKVLLESKGFQVGQARKELRDESKVGSDRATENQMWFDFVFTEHPMWEDLIDWSNHCQTLEAESKTRRDPFFYLPPLPLELKVLDAAWRLAFQTPSHNALFLWKEFWPKYAKDKRLDLKDNYAKQKQRQWFDFLKYVEGSDVTSSVVNKGLREWLENRRNDAVKDQTIDKEYRHIKAVLNHVIDQENLEELNLRPPNFEINTPPKIRKVFSDEDLVALFKYCSDENTSTYAPWKAFLLTIMCQSSAHQKELEQIKRSEVHLDDEFPFVNIHPGADVKNQNRVRIIPVPYRTGLLKRLIEEMDFGQETVLPERVLNTNMTNRNTQLRTIVAKFGDYQPYCTRHTYKHHLSLTMGTPMQIQYLQGWSGVRGSERQRFEQYGQAAYRDREKHPEVFRELFGISQRAMGMLSDDVASNVIPMKKEK